MNAEPVYFSRYPRKQRVALFCTRELGVRKARLDDRLAHAEPPVPEAVRDRLGVGRPWDDAADGVMAALSWFRLEVDAEDGVRRARLPDDVAGSLPFRLLQLVETW